jgi:hypothetical protein
MVWLLWHETGLLNLKQKDINEFSDKSSYRIIRIEQKSSTMSTEVLGHEANRQKSIMGSCTRAFTSVLDSDISDKELDLTVEANK